MRETISDPAGFEALQAYTEAKNIRADLVNAILLGPDLALQKTLGSSLKGVTQLLSRNSVEFYRVLTKLGILQFTGDLKRDIENVLVGLGLAERVLVQQSENTVEVEVYGSAFAPYAIYMGARGGEPLLLPEAFLVAGLLLTLIPSAKVKMRVRVPTRFDEPLSVSITIIRR